MSDQPAPYVVQIVRPPSNSAAVTSLVLGIVGIVFGVWAWVPILGLFVSFIAGPSALVAIILGHIGYGAAKRVNGLGQTQAVAGFCLGYLTSAIIFVVTLFWIVGFAASYSTT